MTKNEINLEIPRKSVYFSKLNKIVIQFYHFKPLLVKLYRSKIKTFLVNWADIIGYCKIHKKNYFFTKPNELSIAM